MYPTSTWPLSSIPSFRFLFLGLFFCFFVGKGEIGKFDVMSLDPSIIICHLSFTSWRVFCLFLSVCNYMPLCPSLSRIKKWWTLRSWMTTHLPFKVMMLDSVAWVPPGKKPERWARNTLSLLTGQYYQGSLPFFLILFFLCVSGEDVGGGRGAWVTATRECRCLQSPEEGASELPVL